MATLKQTSKERRLLYVGLFLASLAGFFVLAASTFPNIGQAATCASGVQEAETGVLTGFEVGQDAAASGGAFVHVPDGVYSSWAPNESWSAQYCFTVADSGMYRIKAHAWANSGTTDSFWVKVDGVLAGTNGYWIVEQSAYGESYIGVTGNDPLEVYLDAGDHTVTIYLREDGTRLDSLELIHQNERCSQNLRMEAEQAVLTGFQVDRDSQASKKRFAWVPEGSGSFWSANQGASAEFCVKIRSAGTYRVEASAQAPHGRSDSFYVSVNGSTPVLYDVAHSDSFTTDLVNSRGGNDPIEFELTPGEHQIRVFAREDGTRLDWVGLTRKPGFAGPCNAMGYEAEEGHVQGMQITTVAGASVVGTAEGSGSRWSPDETLSATYCFDVPTAGNYTIETVVVSPSTTSDSFWVTVNGQAPGSGRWNTALGSLQSDFVSIHGDDSELTVALSPGQNFVQVFVREDGTALDKISLTPAP